MRGGTAKKKVHTDIFQPKMDSYHDVIFRSNSNQPPRNYSILFVFRHKMIRATGLLIFLTTFQSVEGQLSC